MSETNPESQADDVASRYSHGGDNGMAIAARSHDSAFDMPHAAILYYCPWHDWASKTPGCPHCKAAVETARVGQFDYKWLPVTSTDD